MYNDINKSVYYIDYTYFTFAKLIEKPQIGPNHLIVVRVRI
jgi:hypothetical protein